MSAEQRKYNEYDEVNLMPFFRFFKGGINRLFQAFTFILIAVNRRRLFVSFCLIGGIVLAVGRFYLSTPVYHSSGIYASNMLGIEYSEQFVRQLYQLSKEKNYNELSQALNISQEDAAKIKSIEFQFFKSNSADSSLGVPFQVHVYVHDYNLLDSLQYRILDYMENNEYAYRRKLAKISTLTELSEMIQKAITELDTLKKEGSGIALAKNDGYKSSSSSSSSADMAYISPVEIYKQKVELFEEGLSIKEKIKLLKNYELIQGFTKFVKPYSPRLFYDSVVFSVVALVLGAFISIILELKGRKSFESNFLNAKEKLEEYEVK